MKRMEVEMQNMVSFDDAEFEAELDGLLPPEMKEDEEE